MEPLRPQPASRMCRSVHEYECALRGPAVNINVLQDRVDHRLIEGHQAVISFGIDTGNFPPHTDIHRQFIAYLERIIDEVALIPRRTRREIRNLNGPTRWKAQQERSERVARRPWVQSVLSSEDIIEAERA